MNTIRSIVVHLDAAPRAAARLQIALQLARTWSAQVTALYAVTPAAFTVPLMLTEGTSSLLPALEQLDHERHLQTRALYERVVAENGKGLDVSWVDAGREPAYTALAGRALVCDLLLLGQHDPTQSAAGIEADLVATALVETGTPAVVVPYAGDFAPDSTVRAGSSVLVAWKPTREAARAVRAALPWLVCARQVHLAIESPAAEGGPWPGAAQLKAWLALHGVTAELRTHTVGRTTPGEMLLSLAADVAADLLVMGCFGHSRARELVLGGASRSVLNAMTLPVLMAH